MRVSNQEKQKSRARILKSASRLFRENGIAGIGLSDIMKDAGLTHGGFYKHFDDKDALIRAALTEAFASVFNPMKTAPNVQGFRDAYLSEAHRSNAGQGCPIAALGNDVARLDKETRKVMTQGVEARIMQLQQGLTGTPETRAAAIRELATLVGAIVIARTVYGPLSDEVLDTVRTRPDGR